MASSGRDPVRVRGAQPRDLGEVIAIDAGITGMRKPEYWGEILQRYGGGRRRRRFFLVAEDAGRVEGFAIGEVRDWEYGMPPCGWVFAIGVRPDARLEGIGTRLLEAICGGFRRLGVTQVRTILARDNPLILSFFRSQGMMAAPFIALEKDLEP
ncbi:MAG: N-acetyltransferase [Betaproteobacteria bacterium]|nr:MAG: N-acetyltransferase [Betaproteobacteria bacterium]